jgi:hypothetical protein
MLLFFPVNPMDSAGQLMKEQFSSQAHDVKYSAKIRFQGG